ncbi:MAG: alpha/beta hydrolase, partial [Chlamydiae bacterium]|nr:alpha/beta hydrolase [Chlamydiota bacterium]
MTTPLHIPIGTAFLEGILSLPKISKGLVLFAHGSGSSRFSPRNGFVAEYLQKSGLGT